MVQRRPSPAASFARSCRATIEFGCRFELGDFLFLLGGEQGLDLIVLLLGDLTQLRAEIGKPGQYSAMIL